MKTNLPTSAFGLVAWLEKTRVGRRQPSEYQDIYLLLVLPAAALLVLEFVLATTAFRRTP